MKWFRKLFTRKPKPETTHVAGTRWLALQIRGTGRGR